MREILETSFFIILHIIHFNDSPLTNTPDRIIYNHMFYLANSTISIVYRKLVLIIHLKPEWHVPILNIVLIIVWLPQLISQQSQMVTHPQVDSRLPSRSYFIAIASLIFKKYKSMDFNDANYCRRCKSNRSLYFALQSIATLVVVVRCVYISFKKIVFIVQFLIHWCQMLKPTGKTYLSWYLRPTLSIELYFCSKW